MTVRVPKNATLAKYGLSRDAWLALLAAQGNVCAICRKLPPSGRMVTDHEHVKGWKQLPPEQRVRFVRGLLCWTCNHYCVGRGVNLFKLRMAVDYLDTYAKRLSGIA